MATLWSVRYRRRSWAREVVQRGQPAYLAIKETFGDDILGPDLELDRPKLGRIVFADTHQLETLNGIVHPAMMQRIVELVQEAHKEGRSWIVYEAALILEKGLSPTLTEVIPVIADPATQLRRLMTRNGLTEAEARDRMSAQTDNATRHEVGYHYSEYRLARRTASSG